MATPAQNNAHAAWTAFRRVEEIHRRLAKSALDEYLANVSDIDAYASLQSATAEYLRFGEQLAEFERINRLEEEAD